MLTARHITLFSGSKLTVNELAALALPTKLSAFVGGVAFHSQKKFIHSTEGNILLSSSPDQQLVTKHRATYGFIPQKNRKSYLLASPQHLFVNFLSHQHTVKFLPLTSFRYSYVSVDHSSGRSHSEVISNLHTEFFVH